MALLIFSFLLYAAMSGMRPVQFVENSIQIFVPIYALSILLCFLGMTLTAYGASLQGLCCRPYDAGLD